MAAFRATLEEVAAADLLLHVIDASSPDRERQMEAVAAVLAEVGADQVPSVDVFNKCDKLDEGERARIRTLYPGALCVAALRGDGRDEIITAMEGRLGLDTARVTIEFEAGDGQREQIAQLYRLGKILNHLSADGRVSIEAEVPRRLMDRFASAVVHTS